MTCQRCHELMLVDYFIDLQDGGEGFWLRAWRCMNCGEVVEPGIIRHRLEGRSLYARQADPRYAQLYEGAVLTGGPDGHHAHR